MFFIYIDKYSEIQLYAQMILPLLVDNIGQQLSNVIKYTIPDVNNQNICMQIK